MKIKKNLVLLGMMCAGKSTIGNLISKKLNIKFIDTDKVIEKEAKMTIAEIFEIKGETFFRNLEKKTIIKTLDYSNIVIALGGGTFLNEEVRKIITSNHCSFWLNWDALVLLSRIKKNKKRPVANNLTDFEIMDLIGKRSKIYAKAKYKIDCDKMTRNQLTKKIITLYEKN